MKFPSVFDCHHGNTTFPRKRGPLHYIVCLDCGREMDYSWEKMRVMSPNEVRDALSWEVHKEIIARVKNKHKEQLEIDLTVDRILRA